MPCAISARKGVRVRVLTNSLASNDVAAVHMGYARHRKQLLRAGVRLYELNEQIRKAESARFTWLPGLSKSSLHAKTMAIDRKAMFVGSFNFDQRSLYINNEIGILFYEPALAAAAVKHFDKRVEQAAFLVEAFPGARARVAEVDRGRRRKESRLRLRTVRGCLAEAGCEPDARAADRLHVVAEGDGPPREAQRGLSSSVVGFRRKM